MKKRGSILKILGVIFIILVVLVIVAGIYFYNFYVFKTFRVCIGEPVDSKISCTTQKDCLDKVKINEASKKLNDAPPIIKENFQKIADSSISCEKTCRIKKIRGLDLQTNKIEEIESCGATEKEILIKVHGKDAWQLYNYFKKLKENN